MTKFEKAKFSYHGGYLTYLRDGDERPTFVARFKYRGMAHFRAFLVKNFTVEEYFTARATKEPVGRWMMEPAPLTILERKGYVSENMARVCKLRGFPVTRAGVKAMLEAQVARSYAAVMGGVSDHERLCSGGAN